MVLIKPRLKIRRILPEAVMPIYASAGAMAFDLCAAESGTVPAHGSRMFRTGLEMEFPAGWGLILTIRSGHARKHGIRLANPPAFIDSDFRGELGLIVHNDRAVGFNVTAGERVVQGTLVWAPQALIEEVAELSGTERGEGGFGSTGA